MSDDIVARLREEGFITHMGGLPRESKILHAAADEIERLREELRVEKEELAACCIDRKETQRERDEARRLYINEMCLREYGDLGARIVEARERGWDCFKEESLGDD